MIDPEARSVEVHTFDLDKNSATSLFDDASYVRSEVLPSLRLKAALILEV